MDFDVPILSDSEEPPPPPTERIDLDALLNDLTGPQREAVLHTEGPLLVLAAAGSGKTRVITRRIAYLIHCGVPAWQILALTFTNKAAGEMRERIHVILSPGGDGRAVRGLTVTTFHSLCARLLRRYAEPAGLKPDFTIYDTSDQTALVKKAIETCQLSTSNFPARSVLTAISNAKNDLVDADAFAAASFDYTTKVVARVYRAYTDAMRRANAVDFDDLLLLTARVLVRNADVREECRRRYQYLLVDEYQDTNKAQFQIASLIVGTQTEPGTRGPNFCAVGDPDQAIYGWRGADISNILEFEEHYPGAKVITLGENFRSTPAILSAADTLIRINRRRKHKPLFSSKAGGEPVEVVSCNDERQEAAIVAHWLKERHTHAAWRDMAVFYRTNALSRVMEDALREANIPYTIARGTAFYEREEVKNALAYLRVVANPADSVSLGRIINVPTRGIGATTYSRIEAAADHTADTAFAVLRRAESVPDLTARAAGAISKFVAMVDGWTGGGSFMGQSVPHTLHDLVDRIVKESGLESMYKAQAAASQNESDLERMENLAELVSSAAEFEKEWDPAADPAAAAGGDSPAPPLLALLRAYLESIALVADADAVDPSQGSVTLMTLHAAKGLEFPAVAIVGLEEALLPHARAMENDAAMEEERRLCFVGITRAMRRLLMTHAKYRTIRGIPERTVPSRFLAELGKGNTVISDRGRDAEDVWEHDSRSGAAHASGASPRRPGSGAAFPVGCNVRHPQFGIGVVQTVTGGANARVSVLFRGIGLKTLVLEFARLSKV
ncbi:MAG: UvrD-helicase domain-containing protein [Phycisphaerae bacterium]|nr:UvrD-helicase domain-containing protein [Phycisphaerae bacterium]